jgi:mitochondrial-processing peptidase subunit alpha
MANAIDTLGGQIMCSSSRECIMYQSSHFHQGTPLALSLIADTVLNPSYRPDDIFAQRDAARYEIRELQAKPEMALPEVLHEVAYNNQTLGNPLLCREERIDLIDAPLMRATAKEWYKPERIVIAGAGMPHEELVELTDKYFSSLKASPTSPPPPQPTATRPAVPQPTVPPNLLHPSSPSIYKSLTRAASSYLLPNQPKSSTIPPSVLNPHSTYTGGYKFIPDTDSEFSHLYIAFEGVGIHDDDIYTLATMQVLLGGGGSFSAGII